MAEIKTVEAIWLAAAVLTFEKYNEIENPSKEKMYFKQADIVKRAEYLCGKNVQGALASTHCVANSNNPNYNYLVGGEGENEKSRRISYTNEFSGQKERPNLSLEMIVKTSKGEKKVANIYDFVNNEYSKLFSSKERDELLTTTKCAFILEYLNKYAGKPYMGPEKAKPEERDSFKEMKEAGGAAVNELDKMARLCEMDFGLKKLGKSKWLDGSNTKIREYLWQQMKLPGYENCPTSISLFAEIVDDDKARFRFSVELNDAQSEQKDYALHHRILDRDISLGHELVYISGGNNSTPMLRIEESTREVKEKVANGTYKKIQVSFIITQEEINENKHNGKDILTIMLGAIKDLMPYYKLVLGEEVETPALTGIGGGEELMQNTEIALDKNVILYGPPGTGKTYNTVNYAVAIIDNKKVTDLEKRPYEEIFKRYLELMESGRIAFTTFHQSYGYEEFIEGIKPVLNSLDDQKSTDIKYECVDGVFKKFCNEAKKVQTALTQENTEPYVFIIDEINRGNISKIFGELITLVEDTKRIGQSEEASAILPYSGELFGVPDNVYILGTMNTADRSIALMDTALRRRFKFIEMLPKPSILNELAINKLNGINIVRMIETINERIECLFDREHTIGHAYFIPLLKDPSINKLANIFRYAIVPLLQEYFYDDYSRIQLVLGDNAKDDKYKFILDKDIKIRSLFKGSPDVDLPEKKYIIQNSAFYEVESYKQIY